MTEEEQSLQKFIDLLIKDLGLENLPADQKKELTKRIGQIAQHRILQTMLLAIKEEDLKEIDKELEDTDDPEKLYQALSGRIENLDAKIQDSLSELYLNLKEGVKK